MKMARILLGYLLSRWPALSGYGREARYLHAYVHRLRQKLDDRSGTLIRTMPGVGYSLRPDPVVV